jgi:SCY1-like protein 1
MVAPSVIKWFKSPDRLVRINLLNNVNSFASLLPADMINDSIYPSISSGFSDSDHEFRCASVKSMLSLSGKLNGNTINGHLLKCLGKLQVDPVPLIRSMTTHCVSKIASSLRPEVFFYILFFG